MQNLNHINKGQRKKKECRKWPTVPPGKEDKDRNKRNQDQIKIMESWKLVYLYLEKTVKIKSLNKESEQSELSIY